MTEKLNKINKLDRVYTAGLFDGEGSIMINRQLPKKGKQRSPAYFLNVRVKMTDKKIIDWLHQTFGGYMCSGDNPARKNRSPIWAWQVVSRKAEKFLKLIAPFMQVKKHQADLALEYQNKITNYSAGCGVQIPVEEIELRESYKARISALNCKWKNNGGG